MISNVTENSVRRFIDEVAGQRHAMAGAVIAASAAQAVALGLACMQISLESWPDNLAVGDATRPIKSMLDLKERLVRWCDRDAEAIAEFVALREAGDELSGQQLLCNAPAEMCRLSLQAATMLQEFRPLVSERVRDDLEMALSLLAGAAQAAMLLLDSNLRIWPEKALLDEYEPVRAQLERHIARLTPVTRIRN
jgi:formiminotetrahydrofolate cyclodeaminase